MQRRAVMWWSGVWLWAGQRRRTLWSLSQSLIFWIRRYLLRRQRGTLEDDLPWQRSEYQLLHPAVFINRRHSALHPQRQSRRRRLQQLHVHVLETWNPFKHCVRYPTVLYLLKLVTTEVVFPLLAYGRTFILHKVRHGIVALNTPVTPPWDHSVFLVTELILVGQLRNCFAYEYDATSKPHRIAPRSRGTRLWIYSQCHSVSSLLLDFSLLSWRCEERTWVAEQMWKGTWSLSTARRPFMVSYLSRYYL